MLVDTYEHIIENHVNLLDRRPLSLFSYPCWKLQKIILGKNEHLISSKVFFLIAECSFYPCHILHVLIERPLGSANIMSLINCFAVCSRRSSRLFSRSFLRPFSSTPVRPKYGIYLCLSLQSGRLAVDFVTN